MKKRRVNDNNASSSTQQQQLQLQQPLVVKVGTLEWRFTLPPPPPPPPPPPSSVAAATATATATIQSSIFDIHQPSPLPPSSSMEAEQQQQQQQQDDDNDDDDDDDDDDEEMKTDVEEDYIMKDLSVEVLANDGRTYFLPPSPTLLPPPPTAAASPALRNINVGGVFDGFPLPPANIDDVMICASGRRKRSVPSPLLQTIDNATRAAVAAVSQKKARKKQRKAIITSSGYPVISAAAPSSSSVAITPMAPTIHAHEGAPSNASAAWLKAWKRVTHDISKMGNSFSSLRVAQSSIVRLSTAAAREARRIALANFRGRKDVSGRAKRLVVRAQQYWRRHDKEAGEHKKRAAREEEEKRMQIEAAREAQRHQKKLDFLLTQTELYSHFIGKKMGLVPEEEAAAAAAAAVSTTTTTTTAKTTATMNGSSHGHGHGGGSMIGRVTTAETEEERVQMQAEAERMTKARILNQRLAMNAFDSSVPNNDHDDEKQQQQPPVLNNNATTGAEEEEIDLLNPSTMPETAHLASEPNMFEGHLKSYQLKGLNWLINLYEQGINGILADEMGLGKTIQTISFLSYLADVRNIWGPFLIVAPNSTLHQWIQEVRKFAPTFKVLPYWGSQKDRSVIRKFWNPKRLYIRDASFHVLVTSYQVAVNDEKFFTRLKWQYMVLDEAHALKNSSSLRWASLLKLKCRNRLLLTGTPIQNSMAELWSLLHFIMPEFFDSHDEFNEWFSRDIQEHASGDRDSLDAHQVRRLHMILKPFMLRRVKKDVEHEMPPKIEYQVNCPMSARQRAQYALLDARLNAEDESQESLMRLIMQFRKVCNHANLFRKRQPIFPVVFGTTVSANAAAAGVNNDDDDDDDGGGGVMVMGRNTPSMVGALGGGGSHLGSSNAATASGDVDVAVGSGDVCRHVATTRNSIHVSYPRCILELLEPWWYRRDDHHTPHSSPTTAHEHLLHSRFNLFNTVTIHQNTHGCFSFVRFIDMSPAECAFIATAAGCFRWFATLIHEHHRVPILSSSFATPSSAMFIIERVRQRRLITHITRPMPSSLPSSSSSSSYSSSSSSPTNSNHMVLDMVMTTLTDPGNRLDQAMADDIKTPMSASLADMLSPMADDALYGAGRGDRRWLFETEPLAVLDERAPLLRRVRMTCRSVLVAPLVPDVGGRLDYGGWYESLHNGWLKAVLLGFDTRWWSAPYTTPPSTALIPGATIPSSLPFIIHHASLRPLTADNDAAAAGGGGGGDDDNDDGDDDSVVYANPAFRSAQFASPQWLPCAFDAPYALGDSWPSSVHSIPPLLPIDNNNLGMELPAPSSLLADSGKLKVLDVLLQRLRERGHRTLIFSQMTRMIDILEDFMRFRHYKYFRMDGSTQLADRRDMVTEFQTNTNYFAFLLSTRAGGLGINLTGADTVIFYDSDWNPTVDAQAMDRVHRIGQTRQVRVFRLVCKDTVEERILKRAHYKYTIQKTVYAGGFKLAEKDEEDAEMDDGSGEVGGGGGGGGGFGGAGGDDDDPEELLGLLRK